MVGKIAVVAVLVGAIIFVGGAIAGIGAGYTSVTAVSAGINSIVGMFAY